MKFTDEQKKRIGKLSSELNDVIGKKLECHLKRAQNKDKAGEIIAEMIYAIEIASSHSFCTLVNNFIIKEVEMKSLVNKFGESVTALSHKLLRLEDVKH